MNLSLEHGDKLHNIQELRLGITVCSLLATAGLIYLSDRTFSFQTVGLAVVLLTPALSSKMFSDVLTSSMDMGMAHFRQLVDRTAQGARSVYDEMTGNEDTAEEREQRKYKLGGIMNEGNTCFMNSVIQSLASLDSLIEFLAAKGGNLPLTDSTSLPWQVLYTMIYAINQRSTKAHNYTTSALVRSMRSESRSRWSGYEQEDAQEFFQEVLGFLEKAGKRDDNRNETGKLGDDKDEAGKGDNKAHVLNNSHLKYVTPFDGTSASRVGCIKCGETDGVRTEVMSSLSLSLETSTEFDLVQGLDDYIKMEVIPEVECYRCSLVELRNKLKTALDEHVEAENESDHLSEGEHVNGNTGSTGISDGNVSVLSTVNGNSDGKALSNRSSLDEPISATPSTSSSSLKLSDKAREYFTTRYNQVEEELKKKVIGEAEYRKIQPTAGLKARGDKTKQTIFAEPMAKILAIHINRSVFDMRTGYSRKNFAPVQFPIILDLSPFVLDQSIENNDPRFPMARAVRKDAEAGADVVEAYDIDTSATLSEANDTNPSTSTSGSLLFQLKALIVHYGSHNYGHYVAYRKRDGYWWRISDHTVDLVYERQVLEAQGVFMLFYEQLGQESKVLDIRNKEKKVEEKEDEDKLEEESEEELVEELEEESEEGLEQGLEQELEKELEDGDAEEANVSKHVNGAFIVSEKSLPESPSGLNHGNPSAPDVYENLQPQLSPDTESLTQSVSSATIGSNNSKKKNARTRAKYKKKKSR